jgi:AAHS family benzoate transporter-like MFS transporter
VRRTLLFWATVFMSLLILYGVYTWLPVFMTRAGYNLGSAIAFLLILNLGMGADRLATG